MNYPDFRPQGYQVIRELGRNREGGRIAWLASQLRTGEQVVIKQFCFAQSSDWSAYKEHQREIEVLKGLNHPGIPKYLGAFETDNGFGLIQEYKNAASLAVKRSFDPEEIKQIAVKVLEILVYLQNRIPPVIHRDVKPENILVDEQLNVYLIDFGMSRIGSQEVAASSVFKGTPGFIPPEQLRQPTEASDLYGLGATLICLLTGIKSTQIQDLTDDDDPYIINFRDLLPRLSPRFLSWLELMVKPRLKERFTDAKTALKALIPLDVVRVPAVKLSKSVLEFQATHIGEKLHQNIEVVNTMPETLLQGKWKVAPHPQDPRHTRNFHSWIVVEPSKFKGNHINCRVRVDTSKLMADKLYKRRLRLRSNADVEVHSLTVQVKTAPLPIERRPVPYLRLVCSLLVSAMFAYAGCLFVPLIAPAMGDRILAVMVASIGFGMVAGIWVGIVAVNSSEVGIIAGIGVAIVAGIVAGIEAAILAGIVASIGVEIGVAILAGIKDRFEAAIGVSIAVGIVVGIGITWIGTSIGTMMAIVTGIVAGTGIMMGTRIMMAIVAGIVAGIKLAIDPVIEFDDGKLALFTVGLGISSGIGFVVGMLNPYILFALSATGLPLASILLYQPIQHRWLIAKYRKSEKHLIKP
ncbi:serine/threonine protein kinase [Limnospira maxima CS-328]|uniref:non-specific serine/threonine protein kinase n=1 Tax=Limnospira maxima CS-328 TaxID=513049 RepID=B5VUJ2_LIMMA|nr:protein kinase [Limnospira maxima]EDZ97208.1 serine/threonine protein kinase [Limnospira maxima CS-328]